MLTKHPHKFYVGPYLHGPVYEDRGELVSTLIVCFALSSALAGYASGSFYRQYFTTVKLETQSEWQKTMVVTIVLFPAVVVLVLLFLNTVSVTYDAISAVPLSVIIKMIAIWLFVSLPLSIGGTIFGRHWHSKHDIPCRVNSIPR